MIGKFKLNLAAAIIILAFSLWLTWGVQIWGSVSQMLQGIAVSIIIIALLKERISKPVAFFFKGFLVSFVVTSVIWFVTLVIAAGYFSFSLGLLLFIYSLAYVILPRALLPVAISAVVYGITKSKTKALGNPAFNMVLLNIRSSCCIRCLVAYFRATILA